MANDNLEDLKNGKRSADMMELDDLIQENGKCFYEDLLIVTNCKTFAITGF